MIDSLVKLNEQMEDMSLKIDKLEQENRHMKIAIETVKNTHEDVVSQIDYFDPEWRYKTFHHPLISIGDDMANFFGKEPGTEMSQIDVTRKINKYIKINELMDKENPRIIHPDTALIRLLEIDQNVVLTYFNIQKHIANHLHKQRPAIS
tara:strand:- start:5167 stop:5613 length:447 start_codon:yes stop_codon:yes gene_type:complete